MSGKSALITGSSRGIGAEIARAFSAEGAFVTINCIEDLEGAQSVVHTIQDQGGEAELCVADIRIPSEAERLVVTSTGHTGTLDVLVNNAGISKDALVSRITDEDWASVIDTNLTGTFNCCRAAARLMAGQGHGRMINISSVVAEMGNIGQLNYIASKSGVIGLTKGLALELARYGVIVNAIAPGFCTTKMTESIPEKVMAKILARIPLGRFAHPREIAAMAVFLASDECSYMTGQVLAVNGGIHL